MQTTFTHSLGRLQYLDIAAVARAHHSDIHRLPYIHRILLENLCRHQQWGAPISSAHIAGLLAPQQAACDLPLYVNRVILPDSSGLPVLQDLAALRDAVGQAGGDAAAVQTHVPLEVIVDHSLQVDYWGNAHAQADNRRREFERNHERYRFLKWAQQAFQDVIIYPPGSGIIHQIHLEKIAQVVCTAKHQAASWAYPDLVIGGDSHTPTVNALGVLGWGVGGLDAQSALLGQAYVFPKPKVIGVRLHGVLPAMASTTDLALLITQRLRAADVTGAMVEYFGPALATLSVPERATLANMAPEYGASCGFFAVDEQTIHYLQQSGRSPEHVSLVKSYCQANALWRSDNSPTPDYQQRIEINLAEATPSLAGPRRPQDRLPLDQVAADFQQRLAAPLSEGGFGLGTTSLQPAQPSPDKPLQHGSLVLAAITSCANTANPAVMLAAGLLARNAVAKGLRVPSWVKTSLAPGSRVVTQYLAQAGLLSALETLGFHVVGYGCTTCGGKSGPLPADITEQIQQQDWVVGAVLSGNRNFDGRIHKLIRANYIGSPALVVLYALAGRINLNLAQDPLGHDAQGQPVLARDIWPNAAELDALLPLAQQPALFQHIYQNPPPQTEWEALAAPSGPLFAWNMASHYLVAPPFFRQLPHPQHIANLSQALSQCRVLAAFDDSLTTDHISPGGEIPLETPAGEYLSQLGLASHDFNTYVARRGNAEVMARATFANIRLKNALLPAQEGGVTRHYPSQQVMSIYAAAQQYQQDNIASLILAGKEYGTGSSRDWAAKGPALLGVKAVLAESFERIHRANLIGMGILPLQFLPGQGWRQLGLNGSECFSITHLASAIQDGSTVQISAQHDQGSIHFEAQLLVMTTEEKAVLAAGGMPTLALQRFLGAQLEHDVPRGENPQGLGAPREIPSNRG